MKIVKIENSVPGNLSCYFKENGAIITAGNITFSEEDPIELEIEGCLNSKDVKYFRLLCGGTCDFGRNRLKGKIKILNLAEATFVSDKDWYFTAQSEYGYTAYYTTVPQTITSYMFAKLEKLEKIILPSDIMTIERNAFYNCSAREIILPDSIQLLEEESFERCAIETVYVNAIKIKQKCFSGCSQLKEITFGEKVKHINGAFDYNISLQRIELASSNKNLRMLDYGVVNSKGTQFMLYVQRVGCTELVVPENIERICGGAFQGVKILTNIILPDSLQYIGRRAFFQTQIEEIHIPLEVKSISSNAFPSTLKRIYFHSAIPPEMKNAYMFGKEISIYVPKDCIEQYKKVFEYYIDSVQEADYEAQVRKPKKEVKNKAFYRTLVNEIRELSAMEIAHYSISFTQGRFSGESFLNVWKSNLYYIKWMVRLGKITNIANEVFTYLLNHYPLKRTAINNLKAFLAISQIKRARRKAEEENRIKEEEERIKEEYFEYLEEQAWRQEEEDIKEANRQFEDMMNEYDAWWNID
ncbi:leucine-rich repeat domain-containing protein [Parabacteroides sp. ZJ-118]|uniref:leucine-rich repeat domain-containing protein n=1 Tax=Parabacteroides sp. ZJ-118 TaxID=2709398 RepID=UPI0013E9E310|nr:leucine-rich repeat domain-containing protein [Parabacteroides sp. ZJ-118]